MQTKMLYARKKSKKKKEVIHSHNVKQLPAAQYQTM